MIKTVTNKNYNFNGSIEFLSGFSSGLYNKKFDLVSIYLGNKNYNGGYSLKIIDYVTSNSANQTYFVIDSISNENEDIQTLDWSLLTPETELYVLFTYNCSINRIKTKISSIDSTNNRIYIPEILEFDDIGYSIATGNYKSGKTYVSGVIASDGTGIYEYTDLTDLAIGDVIPDNVFEKVSNSVELSKEDLVAGGIVTVENISKGSDQASYSFGSYNNSVGNQSFTIGNSNNNAGTCSFTTGFGNSNAGEFSLINGIFNSNSSPNSVIFGSNNHIDSNGVNTFIIGSYNTSFKTDSFTPQSNIMVGSNNKVYGNNLVVVGTSNNVYGISNTVFGSLNRLSGKCSYSFGSKIKSNANESVLIGRNYILTGIVGGNQYNNSFVVGNEEPSFIHKTKRVDENPSYTAGSNIDQYIESIGYTTEYRGRLKPVVCDLTTSGIVNLDHDSYEKWDINNSVNGEITLSLVNWENGDKGEVVFDDTNITLVVPNEWIVPTDFLTGSSGVKVVEIRKERNNIYAHVIIPF